MFVYYLDGCLTPYWRLFVLSLWLVSLLFIAINGRKLLHARAAAAALLEAWVTGRAYDQMKSSQTRNLRWLLICCVLSIAILYDYSAFFGTFKCTPDSFLWIAPHYGVPPG
jgi:hypothetical protein